MLRCDFFKQLQQSPAGQEYLKLVENAKNNPPEERGEIHHIYPRSFEEGQIDTEDNLVRLSVRDHLLCHYFLAKCFPVPKACYAFRMMWDLHSDIVDRERLFDNLDKAVELRKRGRIKTAKTLQKQRDRALGKIQINKGGKERKIYPKDWEQFEKDGWKRGRATKPRNPSLGKIWVHKEGKETYIERKDFERVQQEGWILGRLKSSTRGKIRMSREGTIKYATEDTVPLLQDQGYQIGVKIRRYRVEKNGKTRYVKECDLPAFLEEGWVKDHSFQKN